MRIYIEREIDEPNSKTFFAGTFSRIFQSGYAPWSYLGLHGQLFHTNLFIHAVPKSGVFAIYCYRYVPADKWDEEKYKDLLTKVLYDYAGIVKAMFAEGASVRDIELALRTREEETAI